MSPEGRRELLLELYHAALAAVEGSACVEKALAAEAVPGSVRAVAIGKAAAAMMAGAGHTLGERLDAGLVITRHGHGMPAAFDGRLECLEAGHPLPDADSLRAGERLLAFIEDAPADASLLFLFSGGASALVEVLPRGMTLDDLQALHRWLLGSGRDIHWMNRVRKAVSLIKGGRLAERLAGRPAVALYLSDVAGDDPTVIGSGLLAADEPRQGSPLDGLPPGLRERCVAAPPAPAPDAPCFRALRHRVVASLEDALQAVVRAARAREHRIERRGRLSGDAGVQGEAIGRFLRQASSGLYLWGGENTVALPDEPGRGGRAQHLALAAARELAGCDDCWLLAAGTDGSDGPGDAAGALVDGGTVARGALEGLDARACLAAADSGRFLEASGDLIDTGPTGTNVTDLVIACKGGEGA